MAQLIVCLDGTDQVKSQPNPTNIAKLFDALGPGAIDQGDGSWEVFIDDAPTLAAKYFPGVGAEGNPIMRFLGGAFGDGIAEPIVRGYTFLSRNYAPGDEIFIVGFSRGATAARALAGLVTGQGLLNTARYATGDKNAAYLRGIAAWYRHRSSHPDLANQIRLDLLAVTHGERPPSLEADDFVEPPTITAVAVFDTVSSLGLPHLDARGDPMFDFSICNTNLDPRVINGFHGLAADEVRDLFSPTLWSDREGIIQHIFPGAHGNVGGGEPEQGLSDAALVWMLDRLESVGLRCDRALISPPLAPDPLDAARDPSAVFPFVDTPRQPRVFPRGALPSPALAARLGRITRTLPSDAQGPYCPLATYDDGSAIL